LDRFFHAKNRWIEGWELSGITRFSSGLPVTLINYGDNSLLGAEPNGINNYGIDEPDVAAGSLNLNRNPRNGTSYFNAGLFSENALGTPGNASRRYFHGPGMENFDISLLKNLRLAESKSLQFRIEAFNVFNHAQFFGPQAVDGNISSSTFGQVVRATAPVASGRGEIHILSSPARKGYRTATVRESVPAPIFSQTRKQGTFVKLNYDPRDPTGRLIAMQLLNLWRRANPRSRCHRSGR
jgi:hypothetical protein